MNLAFLLVFSILALALALKLLTWQPLGKNQGWNDFEHFIRSLLIIMADGESYRLQNVGSSISLDLIRTEGSASGATILLRIPRADWALKNALSFQQVFSAHGYDYKTSDSPGSAWIGEVRIKVDDIWAESCGAKGARAAHLLLDVLAVPHNAKFNFTAVGGGKVRKEPVGKG
jgi:hypothetical protein